MRMLARLLFAAAVFGSVPQSADAQPPGGGRDGGGRGGFGGGGPGGFGGQDGGGMRMGRGGGMNPDDSFNRLQQSYGGTGDVIDYSRVPAETRDRSNRFLQMMGEPPMPTAGTVTRDAYRADFAKRAEKMQAQFGGGRGGMGAPPGAMMAAPGAAAPGGVAVTMSVGGAPGAGGIPGAPQMSDDMYKRMMDRYDEDKDGRISLAESQGPRGGRIRDVFAQYDTNRDGFIDLQEYKILANDVMSGRAGAPGGDRGDRGNRGGPPDMGAGQPQWGQQPQPQWGGSPGGDRGPGQKPEEADLRPVVYRYGKLPTKDLPDWFIKLDDDKDGQIGLYEWRKGGEAYPISRFTPMDLNGDGFITAEEYLLYRKLKEEGDKLTAIENGETPRSSGFGSAPSAGGGRWGGDRGTSSTDSKAKPEKKDAGDRPDRSSGKGGSNPFKRN